jgi:hypothetical protein
LKAKIELYNRILRDNDRYICELTERILRDLGEFKNRVQEVIRQVQIVESREYREGASEGVLLIRSVEGALELNPGEVVVDGYG